MYLDKAKKYLKETNPKLEQQFVGCTDEEIIHLEKILEVRIPNAYKEFLKWFGKHGGNIMHGTDFYYSSLTGQEFQDRYKEPTNIQKIGVSLLSSCGLNGEQILKNSIVFMNHQEYNIAFIKTDEGENPPVYIFEETKPAQIKDIKKLCGSFSDYIEQLLQYEGGPSNALYILDIKDLENEFSYDDAIKKLSFNNVIKSEDGKIPNRIFEFPNLEDLDLRYFNLTEIGPRIKDLRHLKCLNLNQNKISYLPDEFFDLKELEILYLSNNNLTSIPNGFQNLKKLQRVDISNNGLNSDEINKLKNWFPEIILFY